jgi:hypothetical protein
VKIGSHGLELGLHGGGAIPESRTLVTFHGVPKTLDGGFEHLPSLSTEQLRIRQFEEGDAEAIFAIKANLGVTVRCGQEPHTSPGEILLVYLGSALRRERSP